MMSKHLIGKFIVGQINAIDSFFKERFVNPINSFVLSVIVKFSKESIWEWESIMMNKILLFFCVFLEFTLLIYKAKAT